MLKLLTRWPYVAASSLMNATIALESMPPDRNTPSGTSAIIWLDGRLPQRRAQRFRRLLVPPLAHLHIGGVPIALDLHLALRDSEGSGRRQLVDALEDRARRDDVFVGQELVERFRIETRD